MIITNFLVKKRKISQIDSIPYTGEDNIDTFKFEFDEEWNGLDKTLVIVSGSHRYNIALLHDQCVVPFEFYQIKGNVLIGLFGTDGTNQTLATGWLPIYVEEDSYEVGVEPENLPTQTQWDAFVTEINNLLEQAEASEEHCAEILAQMQEDYETYLASLNQIKDDTEDLKDQTQTIKNETNQIKTDVQGLKRQIEQDIADAELRIDEYNANAQAKTKAFNDNYDAKLNSFNDNTTSKTNDFNANVENKTNAFNQNATDKTNNYNDNATQKTNAYNDNAGEKTIAFNNNAEQKTQEFNDNAEEIQKQLDLIISNYNTDTAIGSNIHVDDSLNGPVQDVIVGGEEVTQIETQGYQLFDKEAVTLYKYLYKNNDYAETDTANFGISDYIEVTPGESITISADVYLESVSTVGYIFYDENKEPINGTGGLIGTQAMTLVVPENARYFRTSLGTTSSPGHINQLDSLLITNGTEVKDYEPYTGGKSSPSTDCSQDIVDTTGTNSVIVSNQILPKEYQRVSYIESSGTQYIDTGVVNSANIICKAIMAIQGRDVMCGAESTTGNNYRFKFGSSGSGYVYIGYANTNFALSNLPAKLEDIYIYQVGYGIQKIETIDNVVVSSATKTNLSPYNTRTITLMRFRAGNNIQQANGIGRLYSFQIFEREKCIRNFVPCYRISDNVVGVYDTINQKFYTNAGTGTFAWRDTEVPSKVLKNAILPDDAMFDIRLGDKHLGKYGTNKNLIFKNTEDNIYYNNILTKDVWCYKKGYETIDSYDGEEITTDYKSSTGELSTGAQVKYKVTETDEEIIDQDLLEDLAKLDKMQTHKNETIIITSAESGNPAQLELTYLKDDRVSKEDFELLKARVELLEE